ncbi:MAG TPA: hypothetical protein VE263_13515 [Candidatus Angelobacter sp.]|nr:hypothetical protein [Candidatus Angelobacter sp.]
MKKPVHTRALSNATAHAWKASQELYVIEKGIAETCSGFRVIFSDVADDVREII